MSLYTVRNKRNSPRIHTHAKQTFQETSFCTFQKASYTIEAAVVIPMLAAFFALLLFFFRILQVQYAVEEAVLFAGRKTAVESSAVESPELLAVSSKAYLLYALEDHAIIEQYVRGGIWGVSLLGSDWEEEEIFLKATYEVMLPIPFFEIGGIKLYSQNVFQKWNGDVTLTEEKEEDCVYVTKSGTVYHLSLSCRVLDISIREVAASQIATERGKNGQKYHACSRCPDEVGTVVYCTNYGTLYHTELSCSFLIRTINKIKRSEIGNRSACSYCGKE